MQWYDHYFVSINLFTAIQEISCGEPPRFQNLVILPIVSITVTSLCIALIAYSANVDNALIRQPETMHKGALNCQPNITLNSHTEHIISSSCPSDYILWSGIP
jgi:hypothetical protein